MAVKLGDKKVWIWLGVLVLVAGAYVYFNRSTYQKAQWLVENNFTGGSTMQLMGFGSDYIDAWYDAAKANQTTFALSGRSYNTMGGTAVQAVTT